MTIYKTFVFDCDGVILNSNPVKTHAFYLAALSYGEKKAEALVDYHVAHGGISRYKKFDYFLRHIVGKENPTEKELKELLTAYAHETWKGLLSCEVASGLEELRQRTSASRWLLASGGDQAELRNLFVKRGLSHLFDGGIFGSPDDKKHILNREWQNSDIKQPVVFIGDSKYDYQAATEFDLDFIFVSGWSEVEDWQNFFQDKNVFVIQYIEQLLTKMYS